MLIGATLSSIVTLAEQVLLLPFTSVTVKITVLPFYSRSWCARDVQGQVPNSTSHSSHCSPAKQ